MEKKKLIVGNWKMNPGSVEESRVIFDGIKKEAGKISSVQIVICPPAVFLSELSKKVSGHRVVLGAQNTFLEALGAYTGEISLPMLSSVGAKYIIIGHSENRATGETNEMVNKKILATLKMELVAVLCVGEKERNEGGEYFQFIKDQIESAFLKVPKRLVANVIIAYEPVWAIGTHASGVVTPSDLLEMALFIRKTLFDIFGRESSRSVSILYGGSVDEKNSESFLREGGVDGLLVGRASLSPEKFIKILKIADKI
jgi:triosephosphate isomerase